MTNGLEAPPVLSTPDTHILEATEPAATPAANRNVSDEGLKITYDIERTLREIRRGRWKRVALQFPDDMLPDAPRVFQLLSRGFEHRDAAPKANGRAGDTGASSKEVDNVSQSVSHLKVADGEDSAPEAPRLYILGDTSYGTCCVDEVAAEHVNADVVVHYGRACLSPTARLPVIHVFTHKDLPVEPLVESFKKTYLDLSAKIVIAADVTYADHVPSIHERLVKEGYGNLFATEVLHDPSSPIPNRSIPESVRENPETLKEWQLFHISDPPTALLLTLSSRVEAVHIYPTDAPGSNTAPPSLPASTAAALRRRYAILTRLTTVPVFGILINTLSVKNYLHIVDHVRDRIAAAGKKSYMFVVGKLNAAKVANFSEIGGWVVIGCWESSLVDSKDFWKPVITPFELELTLQDDINRVWTGEWRSDYQTILDAAAENASGAKNGDPAGPADGSRGQNQDERPGEEEDSEEESAPPDFDLRTGRYVSTTQTRPMQRFSVPQSAATATQSTTGGSAPRSNALTKRAKGDLATIGGVVSPGAEFLRSQRTWRGLGSDFEIQYEEDGDGPRGSAIVEGRSGIARGYTVAGQGDKH